jgi:cytochrome c-type biogenesis protein CcmH
MGLWTGDNTTMTPWIILAIMAAFAAGVMSAMLFRARAPGDPEAAGHQARGAELSNGPGDRSEAGTLANSTQAALAESSTEGVAQSGLLAGQRVGRMAALGGLAALALVGLYASIEQPESATQQSTAARSDGERAIERLAALTQSPEIEQSQPGLASVDEMIERLASRLKQRPDDPEGWRMLGWSYFSTQRFSESAAAYLKAIELRPAFAEFRSLRGEALVSTANGLVTADAMRVFEEALALDPADPKARLFKGLAKAQAGDKKAALDDWAAILNGADPNEPWFSEIKQRVTALSGEIGVDVSTRGPPAASSGELLKALAGPPVSANPNAARAGPTAEDVRAADAMAPTDRTAMIRGMVEGLAVRLEQSPHDVEGWIKLIRSRVVLGEADQAKQALDRALAIFDNAPQERSQIAAAARELGIVR